MSTAEMEDAVRNVMEITSRHSEEDKHLFREALKAHNNNVEAVIGEYFSGDHDSFRQKYVLWNDAHFSAERDGSLDPSFHVQGPDQFPADEPWAKGNGANLSAPSRPPSRAHSRSPLGKVTEWTMQTPLDAPTTQEQADEQLRIAMQESMMHTSGVATPQESGVISGDTSLPQFGPANRPYYEHNQWAVVLANAKADDPPALVRKRGTDVPVFLASRSEQLAQRHRLGPLLMILHAIPTARNFFLLLEGASQSFGNNRDWWKGANITATQGWGSEYDDISLVDECQRLMAFLDNTDRAYGTADSLCANSLIKAVWGDPTVKFYESLYNSSASQELIRMWTKAKVEDSTTEDTRPQEFAILEFRIANDTPEMFCNLYSQWDCLFWLQQENTWADQQDEVLGQIASIQVPAQVMTMRISTDGPSIEVPEVLYIDRYLESNVQAARIMQNKLFRMWKAIDLAKEKEIEGTLWTNPRTGQTLDRAKLAEAVIDKSKTQIWRIRASALWRKHENSVGTPDEIPYLPEELNGLAELDEDEQKAIGHYEAEIALAKLTIANLDRKLASVRAERDACCALLRQLNKTWTTPSDDPALNPTHKYSLRGVITSPDVMYMCRRDQYELMGDSSQSDSWYRVAWMSEDDARVKQEATTIEKVKAAMFTDRNADGNVAPILVYATDEALSDAILPLSNALQTFIKFDNRLYRQEQIEDNSQRDKKRVAIREPSSPPKRHRSDSADSISSNRASVGNLSDSDDRTALLSDRFEHFEEGSDMGSELRDMQAISEDEIAAHMVPPTPPLSGDDGSEQDPAELRRSSEKLADMSLGDQAVVEEQQQEERAPEMAELKQPFIVRRPASAMDNRVSIIETPMEVDPSLEIPAVSPEQYYHQSS